MTAFGYIRKNYPDDTSSQIKILIPSILSLGKTGKDLQKIINELTLNEIRIVCIKENIDTKCMYSLNELQKFGKQLGRPAIDEEVINNIRFIRHNKKLNLCAIAIKCNVSLGTIYKYID